MKFAIIGLGHIGKRHLKLIRNAGFDAVTCDINGQAAYTDYREMLKETRPDYTIISSPNGLHYEHALKALEYGHVVIEKPVCLHEHEAYLLEQNAIAQKRRIYCVMQNRYSPPAKWLKEVRPLLGRVDFVQLNLFWNRDADYYSSSEWRGTKKLDGGVLYTQFSHFIDLLIWIFGEPATIEPLTDNAHHHTIEIDDYGNVYGILRDATYYQINYSTNAIGTNLESTITILAEKGTIKIGGQYMDKVLHCSIEGYTMPELEESQPANDYGTWQGSANNHPFVYDNILSGDDPHVSISEAAKVVNFIESVYKL